MDLGLSSTRTPGSARSAGRARRQRGGATETNLTSFLAFGVQASICIGLFFVLYALVLLILFPLLNQKVPNYHPQNRYDSGLQRGEVLKPLVEPFVEKVKHIPHVPGQMVAEEVASLIKRKFHQLRHDEGVTDAHLLEQAAEEFKLMRVQRQDSQQKALLSRHHQIVDPIPVAPGKRTGFMVLGMHRSGTSMLSGLMVTGLGYQPGGPLIGGAFDNEKGFFERIDVVYQNDAFMNAQHVWWSSNILGYNEETALKHIKDGTVKFDDGKKAMTFFQNPANSPWLQKDPRMCITLKTWLKLLPSEPAIVFTYRHPLEVAQSLKKREQSFSIRHGLKLWVYYNQKAVQNSAGLCRVLSSNEAILENPLTEVQRIADDLTSKCGVPAPPKGTLQQEDVDRFVDPNLQHNKKEKNAGKAVIAYYGNCEVHEYKSEFKQGSVDYEQEHEVYMIAMKVYCDFQSGKAYDPHYEWPVVPPP